LFAILYNIQERSKNVRDILNNRYDVGVKSPQL